MALKDITLGQYFPGNSLLHRFDPRSKILFTVLFIAAIFLCKGLVSYGITLLILLIMIGISKVQPRVFLKGMKPVVFIVVCTAILNLFYTSGTVLWSWGILKITEEGIWKAGFMVLRILRLIIMDSSWTGKLSFFRGRKSFSNPSVKRMGEVV